MIIYICYVSSCVGHHFMNAKQAALARKQLERRLAPLRGLSLAVPPRGWMKAIREALGMSSRQLAARMGAAPSRVPAIEKAEVSGATTIRTLREAAAAMNCTFVYAFVPIKPLDDLLRERAAEKAGRDVTRLDHTMQLENQALLRPDLEDERRRLMEILLADSPRRLWEDD
ncbi:mobile mystery protein A (plasmid) [Xanthobacter versatilis]|uniref:Mobile mystery protein A n=2 Tax=Xanthobacteraceae TaxID=335928 RepID=A7IQ49_XANP2|nr:mobile mystery protein A [Xanthobacter autotrophicus Py2]